MVELEPQRELPAEFLAAIGQNLPALLGVPAMAIGGLGAGTDGPISVAISNTGQVNSVVAVHPAHIDSLADTLGSVDEWLSTMGLRELSDLSGNSVGFYEGLLDLSPEASIALSAQRRYLVITGAEHIDIEPLSLRLPDAMIDVHYVDVMQAPGGPVIVRQRTNGHHHSAVVPPALETVAPQPPIIPEQTNPALEETMPEEIVHEETALHHTANAEALPTEETPLHQDAIHLDASPSTEPEAPYPEPVAEEVLDLTEVNPSVEMAPEPPITETSLLAASTFSVAPEPGPEPTIDLTEHAEPVSLGFENSDMELFPGGTYDVDKLPLIFDSTGTSVESISNEMFAVGASIVIVVSLPERRRDSPFEDRRKFRWDTSLDRIQLLNEHGFTQNGTHRKVHLFVENDRQPGHAAYVGALSRTAFQTQTESNAETAWFSITPSLTNDLFRLFRKGRLPNHESQRTIS